MKRVSLSVVGMVLLSVAMAGMVYGQSVEVLKTYSLDSLDGVIAQSDVVFDKEVSSDGKGSLKITTTEPKVIHLFETGDLGVEDCRLTYRAKMKTQDLKGQAYLELWCVFPGKGEFFSRGLQNPLSGTTDWTPVEIPFFLKKGEKPGNVKLNLSIQGTGTVWIDDIAVTKAPLQ